MSKVCAECEHLNLSDIVDGQAWCKEKNERRFANSEVAEECSVISKKWIYDTETANAIKAAEEYQKGTLVGCFITTAIVTILGLDDDCEELDVLRWFRDDVLQVLPEYREILMRYDTVGPIIARALEHDEDKMSISIALYKVFIRGCVNYIQKGDFDKAVVLYKEMVEALIRKYMPMEFVPDSFKSHYDQTSGGHGYIK